MNFTTLLIGLSLTSLSLQAQMLPGFGGEDRQNTENAQAAGGELSLSVSMGAGSEDTSEPKTIQGSAVTIYRSTSGEDVLTKTKKFQSEVKIALVKSDEDQNSFDLVSVKLADEQGTVLLELSGNKLEELKRAARNGISAKVVLSDDQNVPASITTVRNSVRPSDVPANLQYVPLSSAFSDDKEILETNDVDVLREKLQTIASATEKYHRDLIRVISDASALESLHFNTIVDACYFSFSLHETMANDKKELATKDDTASVEKRKRIDGNLRVAQKFSNYCNEIIRIGLPKVTNLDATMAVFELSKLYPGGSDLETFRFVAKKFAPLAPEVKLGLMGLANMKKNSEAAMELALSWLQADSAHNANDLVRVTKVFHGDERDVMLLKGITFVKRMTTEEVKNLILLAVNKKYEVALSGMAKILNQTPTTVAHLVSPLNSEDREKLIRQACEKNDRFSINELVALINASYNSREKIALENIHKLNPMSAQAVAAIAATQSYDAKDSVVVAGAKLLESMTAEQLVILSRATYVKRSELIQNNLAKVSDFSVSGAVRLSAELQADDKDVFLATATSKFETIKAKELIAIVNAAYVQRASLIAQNLDKVIDLTSDATVVLSKSLSYDDVDTMLTRAVAKFKTLSISDLISLGNAAYVRKSNLLVDNLHRIVPLKVADVVLLAKELQYDDKDNALLKALDLVVDLSPSNLMNLADVADQRRDEVIKKGRSKIALSK